MVVLGRTCSFSPLPLVLRRKRVIIRYIINKSKTIINRKKAHIS